MRYVFLTDLIADGPDGMGRKFAGGDVVDESELATGCLESCVRLGHIEPADTETDAFDAGAESTDVADQAAADPEKPKETKPAARGRGKKK